MAKRASCSVLPRTLPVLIALLLALLAAPHIAAPVISTPGPGVSATTLAASASTSPIRSQQEAPTADRPSDPARDNAPVTASPVADRSAALTVQVTAGVRGSRAPPAVAA
jgi:hypothetical protein